MNTAKESTRRKSIDSLLEKHTRLSYHPMLSDTVSSDMYQKHPGIKGLLMASDIHRKYLEAMALIIPDAFEGVPRLYLSALCRTFDYTKGIGHLEESVQDAGDDQVSFLLDEMLIRPDLYAAWAMDAVMISTHPETGICSDRTMKLLTSLQSPGGSMPYDTKLLVKHATTLAHCESCDDLLPAIRFFTQECHSDNWRSVLEFRHIDFNNAFSPLDFSLVSRFGSLGILSDISKLRMGSMLNGMDVVDRDNLFERTTVKILRRLSVSDFRALKKRTEEYEEQADELSQQAIRIVRSFGGNIQHNEHSLLFIEPDEDTSPSNDQWFNNMEKALEKMVAFIEGQTEMMMRLSDQIEMIHKGDWNALRAELKQLSIEKDMNEDDVDAA